MTECAAVTDTKTLAANDAVSQPADRHDDNQCCYLGRPTSPEDHVAAI